MKKLLVLMLTLALALLVVVSASAAGKLTVANESFVVVESYSYYYGYAFAEVTNTGDKPVQYNDCLLEIYDDNGEALDSTSYGTCYPEVLEPGQTGYFWTYAHTEDKNSVPSDYALTLTGKSTNENNWHVLPTTVELKEVQNWSTYLYAYATITNDQAEDAYDFRTMFIVRDADNVIKAITSETAYNTGIPAGGVAKVYENLTYDNSVEALINAGTNFTVEAVAVYETK